MRKQYPRKDIAGNKTLSRRLLIGVGWMLIVLLFASQWYAYDGSRSGADPFGYYLWWSWYMWAVLTPMVWWFANRYPIGSISWQRTIPLHLAASLVLTTVQVFIEASIGWARHEHLSFKGALRHYYSQHIQLSLITYWVIVGATHFFVPMTKCAGNSSRRRSWKHA